MIDGAAHALTNYSKDKVGACNTAYKHAGPTRLEHRAACARSIINGAGLPHVTARQTKIKCIHKSNQYFRKQLADLKATTTGGGE